MEARGPDGVVDVRHRVLGQPGGNVLPAVFHDDRRVFSFVCFAFQENALQLWRLTAEDGDSVKDFPPKLLDSLQQDGDVTQIKVRSYGHIFVVHTVTHDYPLIFCTFLYCY